MPGKPRRPLYRLCHGRAVASPRPDPTRHLPRPLSDDVHYRLLKILEAQPKASQRQLAAALGISLGKINYCVKALLDQGWIKATNFKNSQHKLAYAYLLTPSGVDAKARLTARFLKQQIAEYEALKAEIEQLSAEVSATPTPRPAPD